jgi:3-hydroxyacyl-[acyl-carrier-protein] dehydratase
VKQAALRIAADHPAFDGHFPGRPILPGVSLLAEMIEIFLRDEDAARALGPTPRLGTVKFLQACGPGSELSVQWTLSATRLQFDATRVDANGTAAVAASGHFEVMR